MNQTIPESDFGVLATPDTLHIQRVLPGPIDRVWAYLTDGELRRKWLAAGDMTLEVGAPFEFVWRNDELTTPPGKRPDGFSEEHRMASRITELDPPRLLAFTWDGSGDVRIELKEQGERVLLELTHQRLPSRSKRLGVGPGWHGHLDVLSARLAGQEPEPFWDRFPRLRAEYDRRLPAE